ncbi:MAG: hypothetical protein ACYTHJ_18070 [Planctomycetota bacterium]
MASRNTLTTRWAGVSPRPDRASDSGGVVYGERAWIPDDLCNESGESETAFARPVLEIPQAKTTIRAGNTLVIIGSNESLAQLPED